MADAILGTAEIEIVVDLEELSAGLDDAQAEVAAALDTIDARVSETASVFQSSFEPATAEMLGVADDAAQVGSAWSSLGDAALGLANDVAQVILQLSILEPLLNAVMGERQSMPSLGAIAAGDLLGALGASILGFSSGAQFDVAGGGGIDSQLVAFRATPGEHVTVTPSNDRGSAAAPAPVTVTVHNYSGAEARVDQQVNAQGGKDVTVYIGEAMARDVRTNGVLARAIRQSFGADRMPIQR